jgi:hypothetical protein
MRHGYPTTGRSSSLRAPSGRAWRQAELQFPGLSSL